MAGEDVINKFYVGRVTNNGIVALKTRVLLDD